MPMTASVESTFNKKELDKYVPVDFTVDYVVFYNNIISKH